MARLTDICKIVQGCAPAALATTAGDGDFVSLKGYAGVSIVISVLNATTVTGGAVTLKQATVVAGSDEKELAFATMLANADTAASDAFTVTAVTSNTFTTSTTNSKKLLYVIDVPASSLDVAGGFDCVRIDVASMASAVGDVLYFLWPQRYAGSTLSAITD